MLGYGVWVPDGASKLLQLTFTGPFSGAPGGELVDAFGGDAGSFEVSSIVLPAKQKKLGLLSWIISILNR